MPSKTTHILRWAGAIIMLLLILMLIVEGTFSIRLYHSWPFIIICILASVCLLISSIRECIALCRRLASRTTCLSKSTCSEFIISLSPVFAHTGLFLVLLGGMLGAVVETNVRLIIDKYASERVAYTNNENTVVLPFAIQLEDFRIDYYDDGKSPKQYTSTIVLTDVNNLEETKILNTSVNHPAHYKGWWIYQSNYDQEQGDFCILQLVRDPWLPVVYIGFAFMILSALIETRKAWNTPKVLLVAIIVAALFTVISLARIELKTLVPALRSIWFFPHILVYMIAYSLLAIALVWAIAQSILSRHKTPMSDRMMRFIQTDIPKRLLSTASALLLIGMLCGSIWAKDAWGEYWTWDAKECWAAVTWLITIVGSHIPADKHQWRTLVVIALTFAAIQVTWYGVNYLPSAQYSLHTYNQ